jgi:hypothetical protein
MNHRSDIDRYWRGEFETVHNSRSGGSLFEKALSDTVAYIDSLGLRALIVSPTPDFRFNVGGSPASTVVCPEKSGMPKVS